MQRLGEGLSNAGAPAPNTSTTTCNKVGDSVVCNTSSPNPQSTTTTCNKVGDSVVCRSR